MKNLVISTASIGATTLVSGITGRTIRVLGFGLVADNTVSVKFVSGSTDLTGAMKLGTSFSVIAPPTNAFDVVPYFVCGSGEDLKLNLSGAVQVSGWLIYDITVN